MLTSFRPCSLGPLALVCLAALSTRSGVVSADERSGYFPPSVTATEQILPADTIAMATVPSAAKFRSRWDASSFGAMAADPAFAPFFDNVRERLTGLSGTLGFDLQTVWRSVEGELSLGLVPASDTSGPSRRPFAMVAVANFGSDDRAAERLLAEVTSQMQVAGSRSAVITADGRDLTSWSHATDAGKTLCYFRDGDRVVFADGLATLAKVAALDFDAQSDEQTLAESEAYQTVKSQTQPAAGSAAVRWYVNPYAAVDAAVSDGLARNPNLAVVRGLFDKAGLTQFRGFGGLFDLPGNGLDSVSSTFGHIEGEPRGFIKALGMTATRQQPPRWVKDSVSLYSQMNWSPNQLADFVRETVDGFQGAGTFDRDIAGQPLAGDVTVGDLLDQFEGPIHFAAEVPESAAELSRQSTVIALGIREPETVRQIVASLAGERAAEEVAGAEVFTIDLPIDVPAGTPLARMPAPQLAVSVAEGQLMLSTDGGYLKQTIAGASRGRPLAESPEYREIAANFPERTSVINFQRQDARFAGLYEELREGGMPMVGTTGLLAAALGMDFTKLPPFSAMSRYLQNTGGFVAPAEGGFRIVNFSLEPRER